jgi:hypothetical protein
LTASISAETTRERKVHFILQHRHNGSSKLARAMAELSSKPGRKIPEPLPELLAIEAALEALPDDQLDTQYQHVLAEATRRAADRAAREEERWLGLFEQFPGLSKWSPCRG